jgi:hypothetical protein
MNRSTIHCEGSDYSTDLFTLPGATLQCIEGFVEVVEAGISSHRCESIVRLILDISGFRLFQQPVQ